MIRPKARFFWPTIEKIDADRIIARNIYLFYADSFIRSASMELMMRDDIFIGDRVEVSASHLKYDPQIDYLEFEVIGFGWGTECILEFRSVSYTSESEFEDEFWDELGDDESEDGDEAW